jgi:3-carboxy-cis,cis-muconate cycloisomerase
LIPAEAASAIATLLNSFTPDWPKLKAANAKDGVVIRELVRQIRAALPQHADFVHTGATSQDAIDSATMLAIKDAIALLANGLDRVLDAIAAQAESAGTRPMMAHTRMQRAVEFTVGDKLESWSAPLRRQRATLADLARTLPVLQLGGPVGDRAWFGDKADAVAASLAAALGLNPAPAWHSQRDRIAGFGAWLALVSGTLGKIGADVALLAQNEIGAVTIAGGGSSSAMAHKSNPVAAEMLVTLAHYNAGLSGILQGAMLHENERSGAAWTLEWLVLPEMLVATAASLRRGEELLGAITFRTAG